MQRVNKQAARFAIGNGTRPTGTMRFGSSGRLSSKTDTRTREYTVYILNITCFIANKSLFLSLFRYYVKKYQLYGLNVQTYF